jgi:hypothetical protein
MRMLALVCVCDVWQRRIAMPPWNARDVDPHIEASHGHSARTLVTPRYIPTVGEHAGHALASFKTLQAAVAVSDQQRSAAARMSAVEFVHTCLALMGKFPMQARLDFASVLPFTHLELELMGRGRLEDAPVADAITQRLLKWVQGSPIRVDNADVHAADFLVRLTPHLDLWSQRQHATAAASQLVHAHRAPV